MAQARLKVFGWGREGEGMTAEEEAFALDVHRRSFGVADFPSIATPTLADIQLRPPRTPRRPPSRGSARPKSMTAPRTHMARASPMRYARC
jgi:hypothetical protein